jgi:hypothetical protein
VPCMHTPRIIALTCIVSLTAAVLPAQALAIHRPPPVRHVSAPVMAHTAATEDSILDVAKCAAGVGAFVFGNLAAVTKLRRAGGVIRVARRILRASSRAEKYAAVAAIFGEITGITGVVDACT